MARDPELKYTNSGKAVCSFTLAVNRRKNSNSQGPTADFIPCQAWEKLAEIVGNNTTKGQEILIEGRMQVRNYEAQDGTKKYVTEVVVNEMEYCGSKAENGAASTPENNPGNFGGQPVSNDDIPF